MDILADLRQRHACVTGLDPRITTPIVGPSIFLQAAEEIERLRKERDEAKARIVRLMSQLQEYEAREQ